MPTSEEKFTLTAEIIDAVMNNIRFYQGNAQEGERTPLYPQSEVSQLDLVKMIDKVYERKT